MVIKHLKKPSHNFPYAIHLRCFIHFKRNIKERLKNYEIPAKEASEFIADILGKRVDNTFQIGLVESSSIDEKFSKFKSPIFRNFSNNW